MKFGREFLKSKKNIRHVKGVCGISLLTTIEDFDIISGFSLDILHLICIGVIKKVRLQQNLRLKIINLNNRCYIFGLLPAITKNPGTSL